MTKTHRLVAAVILAAGATAVTAPAANASQNDRPLLFSVDNELAKLNDLGPNGKVARAATSLDPVLGLLAPVTSVLPH
ncbi:hypothetical protein DY245_02100 [Streptomyces inhibens]|uniref:Fasciclin domain-containing protein n=1 Tax=Streptomyces inhibens TaxID=2293571 RepID=A0A371QAX5_STRIH|nr:hypothetical protein [Streptomyces inhibens]REK91860.1 hypothetical protein DY245_02100 [Streptomyces inhibens]